MSFSLYDALVPSWLQILGSVTGLVHKAESHCKTLDIAPGKLIDTRLAPDMLPFGYQVKSTVVHSIGALEAARQGRFVPVRTPWPDSFAGLLELLDSATNRLAGVEPAEVNAMLGRDVRFEAGAYKADFSAEDFFLSLSQPNFYFHATTAYDILRAEGVIIGKIDFLGKMRQKS